MHWNGVCAIYKTVMKSGTISKLKLLFTVGQRKKLASSSIKILKVYCHCCKKTLYIRNGNYGSIVIIMWLIVNVINILQHIDM